MAAQDFQEANDVVRSQEQYDPEEEYIHSLLQNMSKIEINNISRILPKGDINNNETKGNDQMLDIPEETPQGEPVQHNGQDHTNDAVDVEEPDADDVSDTFLANVLQDHMSAIEDILIEGDEAIPVFHNIEGADNPSGLNPPELLEVMVNQVKLTMEVDTGAGVSLVPESVYEQHFS